MNLCEIVRAGQAANRAFTRTFWGDPNVYVYHGMDNQLRIVTPVLHGDSDPSDRSFGLAIADLMYDDYVLCDQPYHGPLAKKQNVQTDQPAAGDSDHGVELREK